MDVCTPAAEHHTNGPQANSDSYTEQAQQPNDPQQHPLWARQVELERGMMREGADRFRSRVVEAVEHRQMTGLAPVRGLLEDWLGPVTSGLKEWIRVCGRSRGPKPLALDYICQCDPASASLIALRAVLDGLTLDRNALTPLASQIGLEVEHECQVRLWEKEEPKLFHAQQKRLKSDGATAVHKRRVNINRFNHLLNTGKFGFDWSPWSQEVCFRVGVELLSNIIRVTQWFDLMPAPGYVEGKRRKNGPPLIIAGKPELLEWLGKQLDHQEVTQPAYKPTIIPPKRWDGTRDGGYFTPYVASPRLVRFKAHQEDQKARAIDEYDAIDMPMVYEAIHFLQEVPWSVNKVVLAVAQEAVAWDMGIGNLPLINPIDVPIRPADFYTNEEAAKAWRRQAASTYSRNAKILGRTRATSRTLRLAMEFSEFQRFYFPHMMDFRGRIYPIPVGLNPQGDDFSRGLLTFAEGKEVTEENGAAGWIAVQLASSWGIDKVSFEDRIAWVEEREEMWRRIAADPLHNLEWSSADKPWQSLAAVFEWVAFLDFGWGYVSHLPCSIDGTCNGIQHLAALLRDEVAAEHVNLIPGEKPRDIYKFVASVLQDRLERIVRGGGEQASLANYWLELCDHELPRTLTKRPVMVLPYGGTKDAFFTYTRLWLDEEDHDPLPPGASKEEWVLRSQRLGCLATALWDVVKDNVKSGVVIMEWLRKCASAVSHRSQPIFWTVPTGFVIRHFYGEQESRKVETKIDGQRVQLRFQTTTKELDTKRQLLGIVPNFVHSMDAAALVLTIDKAHRCGEITAFTSVHDAYGSHAADMWTVAAFLREAFVELHSVDQLAGFRNACLAMLVDEMVASKGIDPLEAFEIADEKLPPLPERGNFEIEQVLESTYFFA